MRTSEYGLGSVAMAYYRRTLFSRIPESLFPLVVGDALPRDHQAALLAALAHINWSQERLGGIPGMWASERRLALFAGLSVERLQVVLGELSESGMAILRRGSEDESAKILEDFRVRTGTPPAVYVINHPACWRLTDGQWDRVRSLVRASAWDEIHGARGE